MFRERGSIVFAFDRNGTTVVNPMLMHMACMASGFTFIDPRSPGAPPTSSLKDTEKRRYPAYQHAMYSMVLKLYHHGRRGVIPKLITWRHIETIDDVV